jgi:hypothetical protein
LISRQRQRNFSGLTGPGAFFDRPAAILLDFSGVPPYFQQIIHAIFTKKASC